MPTTRQVAALGCYIVASTLLVVNTQKAGKLRKNWGAVETHATAYADLVLAVRSAYFIGNPASSFSANVVMIRRALGAAPESTNLRVMDFPRPGSFNEQFA